MANRVTKILIDNISNVSQAAQHNCHQEKNTINSLGNDKS